MSLLRKLLGGSSKQNARYLLDRRLTRFRQIIRNYLKLLHILVDAAEKQAGEYILDKQYIFSLADSVQEIVDTALFDLNVITEEGHLDFYEAQSRIYAEIQNILHHPPANSADGEPVEAQPSCTKSSVSPKTLASGIARSQALFRNRGQVACRGVASGTVFNLEKQKDLPLLPQGAVLVASSLTPAEDVMRLIRRASAILMDQGKPASDVASLARQFRIPAIFGLEEASQKLSSGQEVTVDADDNTIYLGLVRELLDYYTTSTLGPEEETEYRLLRQIRSRLFPLQPANRLEDCKTLHDLFHLAHELAGNALYRLLTQELPQNKLAKTINTQPNLTFEIIDLEEAFPMFQDALHRIMSFSRPFSTFTKGFDEDWQKSHGAEPAGELDRIWAVVEEDKVHLEMRIPSGYDMVDTMITDKNEMNYLYCRFANRFDSSDESQTRGAIGYGILSQLNFDAALTPRAVAGLFGGRPRVEMEERLAIIGRLCSYLGRRSKNAVVKDPIDHTIEGFMSQFI